MNPSRIQSASSPSGPLLDAEQPMNATLNIRATTERAISNVKSSESPGHRRRRTRTFVAGVALVAGLPLATLLQPKPAAAEEVSGFLGCRAEVIVGRDEGDGPHWTVERLDPAGWDTKVGDGGSGWGNQPGRDRPGRGGHER